MSSSDLVTTHVTLIVEGLTAIDGRLQRFLAPRTIDTIVRNLPLSGRVTQMPGGWYFQVGLKIGVEKGRKDFWTGELAYWPLADALCLCHHEVRLYSPANPIGAIIQGLKAAMEVKSSQRVIVVKQRPRGIP